MSSVFRSLLNLHTQNRVLRVQLLLPPTPLAVLCLSTCWTGASPGNVNQLVFSADANGYLTRVCSISHVQIHIISKLSYHTPALPLYASTIRLLNVKRGFDLRIFFLPKCCLCLYCKLEILLETFAERGYPIAIKVSQWSCIKHFRKME